MKKANGILRNRYTVYQQAKLKMERKRTRFQVVGKDSEQLNERQQQISDQHLTSRSISTRQEQSWSSELYELAKQKLSETKDIQKQISAQSKARLTSFKESDNARYDQNIAKLAASATNNLLSAERSLNSFRQVQPNNPSEAKFLKNMHLSLAQEIREASRTLRLQQKQYFDRIRMYEKNTANIAIELTPQQKFSMKNLQDQEMLQESVDCRNQNIQELAKSINKLSTIYKELNQLVIDQGSLIDRIDVNIQETYEHTTKAVVHLDNANQAQSSPFADNFIKALVAMIIVSALLLGFKYMSR